MSLIINGMDMPNDCCQCKLARYDDYENETFCPFTDVMCLSIGRQDNCPLEELPSAQPERCEDCGNFNKTQLLIPQPEPHWIPCSERLPGDGTWNIFSDGKNISVERYKMDAIDHFFPQGRWFSFDKAIAWMPLPEQIVRCKDCEYGVKDDNDEWYCRDFGCRVGDEDGNGFCSDGERRK